MEEILDIWSIRMWKMLIEETTPKSKAEHVKSQRFLIKP